ncbi:MAG: serine/threonine-protein kinase PknK, partial [Verrucomicrobia bacterium]|nr:serine/threonine-protein kinase PknK [Verrucomicrobiota bacterium]
KSSVLVLAPALARPALGTLERLEHEYSLRDELDPDWAVRPIGLTYHWERTVLALEDPGPSVVGLDQFLGQPMELGRFLRLANSLANALSKPHSRGLIHKDIKPGNILADPVTAKIWFTGFGISSRSARETEAAELPEMIRGTLAYMSPEQTGRMNRFIDCRSDLYSLGVTFYQMLTGALPFTASDPMEWVHCHIAKQPSSPGERQTAIPKPVSAIVSKLLSKTAEERYQTAAGLESDIHKCLMEWESTGRIEEFPLCQHDTPDRLLIPEKLYGRTLELEKLIDAFQRVASTGNPELMLVSGYSGIGKSSFVHELHKAVLPNGMFLSGKFDQNRRDMPCAAFAQAFRTLIRQILSKSEIEVQYWRDAILDAVGSNGQLIINLIPEVELVIDKQPPVPELQPAEAENRFQMVFRAFVGVFARETHPLALFLDDLQWLDAATLKLLEDLITHSDVQYLLLIGAFRDKEINRSHPLMEVLESIRQTRDQVQEIFLGPLSFHDLSQLVADTLRCERMRAEPLAQLVYDKTQGNPFFSIQFLATLHEEHLLEFDARDSVWKWDLKRIRAKGFTDNVLELMLEKLRRFSGRTQQALKLFACLGGSAETATIAMVLSGTQMDLHSDLLEALQEGVVLRRGDSHCFLHDRVQEAAYALIPQSERAKVHLKIGRLLIEKMSTKTIEGKIFEIVSQFNSAFALISAQAEKDYVAELNLKAGRKAKTSMAHPSARTYFSTGMKLLGEDAWERRYDLAFGLWLGCAECEFLNGNFEKAEELITVLLSRTASRIDKAAGYRLKILLHLMRAQGWEAVESGLECLRLLSVEMPVHPTQEQCQTEYEEIWRILGRRSIESIVDLPLMTDPEKQAAMQLLAEIGAPAQNTDINLHYLIIFRLVTLSLKYGTT